MVNKKTYSCFLLFILCFCIEIAAAKSPLCISLGFSCSPALNLRALGIRAEAYPFDWIISPKEIAIKLRDLLRNKYPTLNFVLIALATNESFKSPWNIDGIKNLYISHWWDSPKEWEEALKQIGPEFQHIVIKKQNILSYPLSNCCLEHVDGNLVE